MYNIRFQEVQPGMNLVHTTSSTQEIFRLAYCYTRMFDESYMITTENDSDTNKIFSKQLSVEITEGKIKLAQGYFPRLAFPTKQSNRA